MRRPCWNYGSDNNWGDLCAAGKEQSPINIINACPVLLAPPTFNYRSSSVNIEHAAHTLRVNLITAGNTLAFKEESYELKQFHFHHQSEHLVAGQSFPLELHLVHANSAGKTVVVGIFFQANDTINTTIAPVWAEMPLLAGDKKILAQQIDLCALLPDDLSAWIYQGSLTTPPCTEGVEWIILTKAMQLSTSQLQLFKHRYPRNCRPTQALGERTIFYLRGEGEPKT